VKNQDLGASVAERFFGGVIDKMTLAGSIDNPFTAAMDMQFLDYAEVAEGSESWTTENPVMGWQGQIAIDGTKSTIIEQVSIDIANNVSAIPNIAGNPYNRGFAPGMQVATGTINLGAESHAEWTKMRAGTQFALTLALHGDDTTALAAVSASSITSVPYGADINLPECYYTSAGGQQNGAERMVEALPFVTEAETNGWPLRVVLRNQTASYPNAS